MTVQQNVLQHEQWQGGARGPRIELQITVVNPGSVGHPGVVRVRIIAKNKKVNNY